MSDVAKDIADYLDAGGIGTVGTDIFYGQMPGESVLPATTPAVAVIESGGFDPNLNSDRKHYTPTITILVQGIAEGYTDSQDKADAVQDLMTDPLALTVGSVTYYGAAQQGGRGFFYDENNRPTWTQTFAINWRNDR